MLHCLGAYALHMLGGKIYTLWYFYLYVQETSAALKATVLSSLCLHVCLLRSAH